MQENLAIASVPLQEWGALYETEEALRVGTVFQDLDKPFFAVSGDGADGCACGCASGNKTWSGDSGQQRAAGGQNADPGKGRYCDSEASSEQQERERMMAKIQETSFALDDARLYLDTHPDDRQGLAFLKDKLAERKKLLLAYTERFYPLTADCMADLCEKDPAQECYCWQKGPMPWEGACV